MGKVSAAARTGAERYFEQRRKDAGYEEAHQRAVAMVSAIDDLVRALDAARRDQHLSKAELARRVGVDPAAVRRFFSTDAPNPTAQWLVQVALALGYRFNLEPDDSADFGRTKAQAKQREAVTA